MAWLVSRVVATVNNVFPARQPHHPAGRAFCALSPAERTLIFGVQLSGMSGPMPVTAKLSLKLLPELPDIELYLAALKPRVVGRPLGAVRITSPFVLRTVEPPITALPGRVVLGVSRLGKRIVLGLEDHYFVVVHLMIAGRLRWKPPGAAVPRRAGLAAFDFPEGTLLLTEAGKQQRASLHLAHGAAALAAHDPGGLEVLDADLTAFRAALARENHTLKRALTDPRLFAGIGNAYSDEILHAARLSPLKLTSKLAAKEAQHLFAATRQTLTHWIARLQEEARGAFPEKVTAFREGMAVHGRYRKPCPECGAPVQRIRYAENELNYCPRCQTDGRVLADRALSRLLKQDWPRTLEELEARRL
jgi:formamidopyrimidine-DNA glycosylase